MLTGVKCLAQDHSAGWKRLSVCLGLFIATQSCDALCSVCMVADPALVKRQEAVSVGCAEGSDTS